MTRKHLQAHITEDFTSADTVRNLPELNGRNHGELSQFSRLSRLHLARHETDKLFALMDEHAIYERPIPERHRLIFYLGHFDAFDWNQICRFALGMNSFHPTFDKLFEAGIDPEPGKAPADRPQDWPGLDEVKAYVKTTRERVDEVLSAAPAHMFETAIEHRFMHAETFAYLLHELAYEHKHGTSDEPMSCPPPEHGSIDIPEGVAVLGQERGAFGWDNEFDRHEVQVPGFRIAQHKVTNGEYLEFVRQGAAAPYFWLRRDGKWYWRGMFELMPLDLTCPVYVTHEQASAYANWRGGGLPTEAQFHRTANEAPGPVYSRNMAFARWDPVPVTADSGLQLIGNGWEWTATPFGPFEGFEPFENYPGYSQPFFDGAHFVMKGASPRTALEFRRPSFRNWFRANYPYVYSTFRLVQA